MCLRYSGFSPKHGLYRQTESRHNRVQSPTSTLAHARGPVTGLTVTWPTVCSSYPFFSSLLCCSLARTFKGGVGKEWDRTPNNSFTLLEVCNTIFHFLYPLTWSVLAVKCHLHIGTRMRQDLPYTPVSTLTVKKVCAFYNTFSSTRQTSRAAGEYCHARQTHAEANEILKDYRKVETYTVPRRVRAKRVWRGPSSGEVIGCARVDNVGVHIPRGPRKL